MSVLCNIDVIIECHDDIRGGKNADGQRWPENYWKALRERQRRRHRDHPQQNQEEREFVCRSVWLQDTLNLCARFFTSASWYIFAPDGLAEIRSGDCGSSSETDHRGWLSGLSRRAVLRQTGTLRCIPQVYVLQTRLKLEMRHLHATVLWGVNKREILEGREVQVWSHVYLKKKKKIHRTKSSVIFDFLIFIL